MQRHKSKVMRRSRRKGRSGTRKQSGGLFGFITDIFKPKSEAPPAVAPATPGAPVAPAAPPVAPAATPGAPPAVEKPKTGLFGLWGGSRKKSRKTQHHRRRRHHRK